LAIPREVYAKAAASASVLVGCAGRPYVQVMARKSADPHSPSPSAAPTAHDAPVADQADQSWRWKLPLVLLLTIVMAALVLIHVKGVNGPWYWKWSWRRLSWWIYAPMLAAAVPFAAAQWLHVKGKLRSALVVLTLATLVLEIVAISCQPAGFERLMLIASNATNTSYWTDARIMYQQENIPLHNLLSIYDLMVPDLHLHVKYKPPGLVLYYYFWISLFGTEDASAWAGAIGVAIFAALAVPACYWLIKTYGRDAHAAFCAASFLALSPSLILFLPQFDQVYPSIACAILVTWCLAARDLNWKAAIACGALLWLGTFCSYIFLTLGCFIVVYWMLLLSDKNADHFFRAAVCGLIAVTTAVVLYAIVWAISGFDPIATYHAIAATQSKDLLPLIRPFPRHILFDVIDFGMGSGGWISYLLVLFYLMRVRGRIFDRSPEHRLVLVALIQIGTVALAALLPGEVARLWMLYIPLLMAPVGFELARWPTRPRMIVYACVWVMLTTICQILSFLYMGEGLDGERQYDTWPVPGPNARR
jgi:hypothetical protein